MSYILYIYTNIYKHIFYIYRNILDKNYQDLFTNIKLEDCFVLHQFQFKIRKMHPIVSTPHRASKSI